MKEIKLKERGNQNYFFKSNIIYNICLRHMNKGQQFKCNQCLQAFGPLKIPLKMPHCLHNVCQRCFDEVKESKMDMLQCGFCGSTMVECKTRKLQINRVIKDKSTPDAKTTEIPTPNSPLKMHADMLIEDADMLLLGEQFSSKRKHIGLSPEKKPVIQMCATHDKPLEIICLTDLKRICPHCAIFGNHKDHKFKSLREFDEDFNQNLKRIHIVKEKKYKLDKKMNIWEQEESVKRKLRLRKDELREAIDKRFQTIIQNIKDHKDKVMETFNDTFLTVEKKIRDILREEDRVESKFAKWQSECQNLLSKINQNITLNEKISIMYGPLAKIKEGEELITEIEKKVEAKNIKVQEIVNNIKLDTSKALNLNNIAIIYVASDEVKKDNFLSIIERVNNPNSKHIFDEVADFSDNSFICDYSREDLSVFIEQLDAKTPMKKDKSSALNQTVKFTSPDTKNLKKRLIRSRSNNNFKIPAFDTGDRKSRNSRLTTEAAEVRNPDLIVSQFLKHDLRQVLDLSQCNLNDENSYKYVKDVRRYRKIRGLKLNKNCITDNGFLAMLQLFSSTSNLNVSNNQLTEECLHIIVKNKQKFSPLRIINISQNKIMNDKRAKLRVQELKKLGITVTL